MSTITTVYCKGKYGALVALSALVDDSQELINVTAENSHLTRAQFSKGLTQVWPDDVFVIRQLTEYWHAHRIR